MKKGFTLIELLAVVLIMAVLTSVALPQYRKSVERARAAEALQMLPVIYDARDRLMTENNYKVIYAADRSKMSFSKLDVSFKGNPVDDHTWRTENYEYKLFAASGSSKVSAKLRKGKYTDTLFEYDGKSKVSCSSSIAGACTLLGMGADSSDECGSCGSECGSCGAGCGACGAECGACGAECGACGA